jgi:hypothetical protein
MPPIYKKKDKTGQFGFFSAHQLQRDLSAQRDLDARNIRSHARLYSLSIVEDMKGNFHPVNITGTFPFVNGLFQYYFNPHMPKFRGKGDELIQIKHVVDHLSSEHLIQNKITSLKKAREFAQNLQDKESRRPLIGSLVASLHEPKIQ